MEFQTENYCATLYSTKFEKYIQYFKQFMKAEVGENLTVPCDILENYKFNWNNEKHKASNHIKVLDIKQSAEHKINLYNYGQMKKVK